MNTQFSVQSWAIASHLFLPSRSPNTSWRLRLMRVSIVSGTALSHTFVERFPNHARTSRRRGIGRSKKSSDHADDHPLLDLNALRVSSTNSFGCSKAAKRGRVRRRLSCASPVFSHHEEARGMR